jgi:hypothetical protein
VTPSTWETLPLADVVFADQAIAALAALLLNLRDDAELDARVGVVEESEPPP